MSETKTRSIAPEEVLEGQDLIVSKNGKAIAYAKSCKITTSAETKSRRTKEARSGKWEEKKVSKISQTISVDGLEARGEYDDLLAHLIAGDKVTLTYGKRDGTGNYTGEYIITSLDLDGPVEDDAKYSAKFENTGPVSGNSLYKA